MPAPYCVATVHLLSYTLTPKCTHHDCHRTNSHVQRFGFINDVKAGIPRTAYKGVTMVHHRGCRKLLVADDSPLLPAA